MLANAVNSHTEDLKNDTFESIGTKRILKSVKIESMMIVNDYA